MVEGGHILNKGNKTKSDRRERLFYFLFENVMVCVACLVD